MLRVLVIVGIYNRIDRNRNRIEIIYRILIIIITIIIIIKITIIVTKIPTTTPTKLDNYNNK